MAKDSGDILDLADFTFGLMPKMAVPRMPAPARPRDYRMADWMHECLWGQLRKFQEGLAPDQEVGICLANFGRDVTIVVEDLGFHNPDMLIVIGTEADSGDRVRLLQHVAQISLLLRAVQVPQGREARRIGFDTKNDNDAK